MEYLNVFYNETFSGHHCPRAVLVDLDPSTLDTIRAGPYGQLFQSSNFIRGNTGTNSNWAKGMYSYG